MIRALALGVFGLCAALLAEYQTPASTPSPQITVTELPPSAYPPMALAAHVWGNVPLRITLQPDGSPGAIEAESGPPMLRQPAVEIARKAKFSCSNCQLGEPIEIEIHFVLGESVCPDAPHDPKFPFIKSDGNVLTIAAQPFALCDYSATIGRTRTRSLKCLYLWQCGWRATAQN